MSTSRNIRFYWNNYPAYIANASLSASSAASGYSASNIVNSMRSLPLRFGGNFTIGSTNKNLYINDGADKTVTLDEGNYTYAALASHVETKLNAASSGWTCSYDFDGGTFKFTISRSSSGALRFSQTTDAVWDTLGYLAALDDTSGPWPADEQRNHTDEWVKVDLVSAREVDAFFISGVLDQVFPVSSTAVCTLQANSVDSWTSPPLSRTLTRTDDGFFEVMDDLAAIDKTYRYWLLKIVDRTNSVGPEGFDLAYLSLAPALILEHDIVPGFAFRMVDPSVVTESDSGVRYIRNKTKYRSISGAAVSFLDNEDRVAFQNFVRTVGVSKPFYVQLDPTLAVFSSIADFTFLASFEAAPVYQHVFRQYFDVSFDVREWV